MAERTSRAPRIVAIGGGTGLSTILRGLKHVSPNITTVVAIPLYRLCSDPME